MSEEADCCSICLESLRCKTDGRFKPTMFTECEHCFHADCLTLYFRSGHIHCPLCRMEWKDTRSYFAISTPTPSPMPVAAAAVVPTAPPIDLEDSARTAMDEYRLTPAFGFRQAIMKSKTNYTRLHPDVGAAHPYSEHDTYGKYYSTYSSSYSPSVPIPRHIVKDNTLK